MYVDKYICILIWVLILVNRVMLCFFICCYMLFLGSIRFCSKYVKVSDGLGNRVFRVGWNVGIVKSFGRK